MEGTSPSRNLKSETNLLSNSTPRISLQSVNMWSFARPLPILAQVQSATSAGDPLPSADSANLLASRWNKSNEEQFRGRVG